MIAGEGGSGGGAVLRAPKHSRDTRFKISLITDRLGMASKSPASACNATIWLYYWI
jgi:hypothetical protein